MKILIIGGAAEAKELSEKLGPTHEYIVFEEHKQGEKALGGADVVFDFIIDEHPGSFPMFQQARGAVFLNTCNVSLRELYHLNDDCKPTETIFGFNGMPTFINRKALEVTLYKQAHEQRLRETATKLGTEIMIVDDRVGLVTPRVISMIINEAYYTVQEGTATREAIDMAMKLGTNYPFGPFEWCQRIGIHHVYDLLEAVYNDTRDERYKTCPLLKKDFLEVF